MEIDKLILNAIYDAADEINAQLPADQQLIKSPETMLAHEDGNLDSLSFFNLISIVEENVADSFGQRLRLLQEEQFDLENNPFRTMGSVVAHIAKLLGPISP
jgi:acyl carrier protein